MRILGRAHASDDDIAVIGCPDSSKLISPAVERAAQVNQHFLSLVRCERNRGGKAVGARGMWCDDLQAETPFRIGKRSRRKLQLRVDLPFHRHPHERPIDGKGDCWCTGERTILKPVARIGVVMHHLTKSRAHGCSADGKRHGELREIIESA